MPRKMARKPRNAGPDTPVSSSPAASQPVETFAPSPSKISLVLDLLQREEGASLAELVELTGWLPHTTRAALTGLRKKGHAIGKDRHDGETRYAIRSGAR